MTPGSASVGEGRRSPSVDRTGDDELAAHLEAWLAAELTEEIDTNNPGAADHADET